MTNEQLDEIEKLAEKWRGWGHASEKWAIRLADSALPMVKALREARERCDTLQLIADAKSHDSGVYARRMEQAQIAGREARAEVERLKKRLESEQHFIDAVCHYRNLAIVLGAKPEQMLGKFDRELCEGGIDPNETSGGYHVSVNQQLDELKDVWGEVERLRAALRLLWEEAQDKAAIRDSTTDAVAAALKEGDR